MAHDSTGKSSPNDAYFVAMYAQLREVAGRLMSKESPTHTLQPTALLNEAFVRLRKVDTQDKDHLFALTVRGMSRILIDHARRKKSQGQNAQAFDERVVEQVPEESAAASAEAVSSMDIAQRKLAEEFPRAHQVMCLHVMAEMEHAQIAELLGVSLRTVKSDWQLAKAALLESMQSQL